jgi:2,3-bisphosphoglycerate-independent phosphoglycerate mutase
MGLDNPEVNPVYSGVCPNLLNLLKVNASSIDAGMGVEGIPQSATGQTALMTGVNAARHMGRHVAGFPGPSLQKIVRANNIYDKLGALEFSSTFANAYYVSDVREVETRKVQSVTTVAALKAFGCVRDKALMEQGKAVYQDLTRESLRSRGYEGSLQTPIQAAQALVSIAREYDFTLFEYFQTDRMGHKGTWDDMLRVLGTFDEFLGEVLAFTREEGALFVLTSDHGNIERFGSRSHSLNPVPLVAIGQGSDYLKRTICSVTDVTPALIDLYSCKNSSQ